jgi:tetratricopeptide (TPR) repeat protein
MEPTPKKLAMTGRALIRFQLLVLLALLWSTSTGSAGTTFARTSQTPNSQSQSGIALYEKGDFPQAVKILKEALSKDKNNVEILHYLGLAYEGAGKAGDARKSHEKAAKAGELLLIAQTSKGSETDYLERLRKISPELRFASSSAIKYLQLSPGISKSKHSDAEERAELLSYVEKLSRGDTGGFGEIISTKEATTKPRILSKPDAQYTEVARQHQITGTVILRAILGQDGKVYVVIPVKPLPDGLTERAISAARQITFQPATKDGHPVSVLIQLEYNFNLY